MSLSSQPLFYFLLKLSFKLNVFGDFFQILSQTCFGADAEVPRRPDDRHLGGQ